MPHIERRRGGIDMRKKLLNYFCQKKLKIVQNVLKQGQQVIDRNKHIHDHSSRKQEVEAITRFLS